MNLIQGIGNMFNDEPEYDVTDIMAQDSLRRCFKKWGVEATEEKIHELCCTELMLEVMLRNYKKLVKGK